MRTLLLAYLFARSAPCSTTKTSRCMNPTSRLSSTSAGTNSSSRWCFRAATSASTSSCVSTRRSASRSSGSTRTPLLCTTARNCASWPKKCHSKNSHRPVMPRKRQNALVRLSPRAPWQWVVSSATPSRNTRLARRPLRWLRRPRMPSWAYSTKLRRPWSPSHRVPSQDRKCD